MPIPSPIPPLWGVAGLLAIGWKLGLVVFGAYAVFGRRLGPFAARWLSPVSHARKGPAGPAPSRWTWGDRLFILLVVMAATAVATAILARFSIATHSRIAP